MIVKKLVLLIECIFLFCISVINVEARSGCCSHHGGVCGCGCCDGTSLSSTCLPYYPECGVGNVYQEQPNCPLMSTYNSYTDKCECYSGYIAYNNTCLSVSQWCSSKYGYNSEPDYSTNQCKCRYGYVWNNSGTSCISADQSCQNQYGYNSKATVSGDKCECKYGYVWNQSNTKCISLDEECKSEYGYNSKAALSGNQCECNYGYIFNKSRTICITKDAACQELNGPMSKSGINNECECLSGYEYDGFQCIIITNKNLDTINKSDKSKENINVSIKPSITSIEPTKSTILIDSSSNTSSNLVSDKSISENFFNKLFSQIFGWLFSKK